MTEKKLLPSSWDLQSEKLHANCRIFEVRERRFKRRSDGVEGDFYVLDTNDWVNVLAITPEQKESFWSDSFVLEVVKILWNLPVAWWKRGKIQSLPEFEN